MTTILYASVYGSTKQYADELGRQLGVEPMRIDAADPAELRTGEGPLITLSYTHGPSLPAASFLADHDFGSRPLAACAVGMSLVESAEAKDQMAGIVGKRADVVTRFYLPGRLNYSQLSGAHAKIMFGIISALRLKPRKSANDRSMIAGYNHDEDRVDVAALAPVVAWARAHGA